jgi:hypothetical protein
MKSGRRRGFTDFIIRSLGAAVSAALPAEGEAAGGEGLRAKRHATSSHQPGALANARIPDQPEERKKT